MIAARGHRGFVLLLTLVLVLIAGVTLAALARRSVSEGLRIEQAEQELCRRWAARSARHAVLAHAPVLLDRAEGRLRAGRQADAPRPGRPTARRRPRAELRVHCRLVDTDYELILTDEQAKLNVNAQLQRTDATATRRAVRRLTRPVARAFDAHVEVAIRPRKMAFGPASARPDVHIGALDQVFDGAAPDVQAGDALRPGLASMVTCWGDGKINLHRAPRRVLEVAFEGCLTRRTIDRILAVRSDQPYVRLDRVRAVIGDAAAEQWSTVTSMVTDESRTFGLWVIARQPQRSWYEFAVATVQAIEGDGPVRYVCGQPEVFKW
jgi:hypothetical protein